MDFFERRHPAALLLWFLSLLIPAMIFQDPICVAFSYVGALIALLVVSGARAAGKALAYSLILSMVVAVGNCLFSHGGITLLFYVGTLPITREALLFGLCSGFVFATVLIWFSWFSAVFTQDKIFYVLHKISPAVSMVLVLTFTFIPRLRRKAAQIACENRDAGEKTRTEKLQAGMDVFNALVVWSMEHSITTADSMNGRGYGIGRRTSYRIYRMKKGDVFVFCLVCSAAVLLVQCAVGGFGTAQFYPIFIPGSYHPFFYVLYGILVSAPSVVEFGWRRYVNCLQSKI